MPIKDLKTELDRFSPDRLKEEILYLYKNFKQVKEYYDNKSDAGNDAIMDKYSEIILKEFFPDRGNPKLRLSVARKAISDFKKINKSPVDIAHLMVFYVETGVDFTNEYGDIDYPFYKSMESMFISTLKYMQKNKILPVFKERAEEIVGKTKDIGWGFHDSMVDLYGEYYPD